MKRFILIVFIFFLMLTGCTNKKNKIEEVGIGDIHEFAIGFSGADGIVIDNQGNMYVGNRKTNAISKVTKDGKVDLFVKLSCKELLTMTYDNNGNIYAACKDKVFKITPEKDIIELASDFTCADDLRLDLKGNLYVTDSFENRVYKITSDLRKSIYIDSDFEVDFSNNIWYLTGITFDNEYNNLYLAKMYEGKIIKYSLDSEGNIIDKIVFVSTINEPDHLEMDSNGNLYVTLFRDGSLISIDKDGNIKTICDKKMGRATGLSIGKGDLDEKYMYVADYGRNIVYKIYIG